MEIDEILHILNLSIKRAANRPKDQAHILELLELQKLLAVEPSSDTS